MKTDFTTEQLEILETLFAVARRYTGALVEKHEEIHGAELNFTKFDSLHSKILNLSPAKPKESAEGKKARKRQISFNFSRK